MLRRQDLFLRSSPFAKIKRAAILGRTLQGLCLLLCLVFPFAAHAADVRATLDRTTVQLGETVTLNLHIKGGTNAAMLDLSPLEQDFDILGGPQSSIPSIINGQGSAELVIGIVLRPKHAGTLVVPSLSVGGAQTAPLQLVVGQANPSSAAAADDKGVFMESELAPQHAWVGQQLSYVVRLYLSGNVVDGTLEAPKVDGAQLNQIGGDLRYEKVLGNREYSVIERHFALVPQHAGTLTVPPMGFRGVALDPNDPDNLFGAGTQVSASAPAQTVQVQAAPANWGQSAWLPASALSLALSGWPDDGTPIRVGQPINLTMTLSATGLSAEALPQLSLPAIAGAAVYPDQPKTATANDDAWLQGSSERKFAVVPERPGTLTLPATTLRWFDVTSGQEQTAEIPAHSITVLPAAGAAAVSPVAAPPVEPAAAAAVAATPASAMLQDVPWRWVAMASLLLWLGTVLAWWLWWRRTPRGTVAAAAKHPSGEDARLQRQAFLVAARGDDAAAQLHSLLAWAQAERPAIRNAGELEAALADAAQRHAIVELQRRRYGNAVPAANVDLAAAFKNGFAWRNDAGHREDGLPPLYPFKLE